MCKLYRLVGMQVKAYWVIYYVEWVSFVSSHRVYLKNFTQLDCVRRTVALLVRSLFTASTGGGAWHERVAGECGATIPQHKATT